MRSADEEPTDAPVPRESPPLSFPSPDGHDAVDEDTREDTPGIPTSPVRLTGPPSSSSNRNDEHNPGLDGTGRRPSTSRGRMILMRILYERFLRNNPRARPLHLRAAGTTPTTNTTSSPSNFLDTSRRLPLRYWDGTTTAVCRFCLESSSPLETKEKGEGRTDDTKASTSRTPPMELSPSLFIAPCACRGSSEYVHVACLQKWQCTQQQQNARSTSAWACQVCTLPYSVPPPVLKTNLVQKGTLLVFLPQQQQDRVGNSSTFDQTIILMLQVDDHPIGVILNKKSICIGLDMEVRRGGPVCGGRLGITRYLVARVAVGDQDENHRDADAVTSVAEDRDDETLNRQSDGFNYQAIGSYPQLSFLVDQHEELEVVDRNDLYDLEQQHIPQASSSSRLVAFQGYCKWGRQQLQSELLSGAWGIVRSQYTKRAIHQVMQQRLPPEPSGVEGEQRTTCPVWKWLVHGASSNEPHHQHLQQQLLQENSMALVAASDTSFHCDPHDCCLLSRDEWFHYPSLSITTTTTTTTDSVSNTTIFNQDNN